MRVGMRQKFLSAMEPKYPNLTLESMMNHRARTLAALCVKGCLHPMKLRLILLALLCCTNLIAQTTKPSTPPENEKAIIAWLQQNAIPIRHDDAENGFADLQPLKKILRDVKIVGLGEATHGTREFFQIKHRLLEFLLTEMGFNAFALEASFAACQPINDYVLHGKGDRATVLSGQFYIPWDMEEFAEMLDWIRTYNQNVPEEKKIRFYGLDLLSNGLGRTRVLAYLSKHAADKVAATDSLFQALAKIEAKWPTLMDDNDKKNLEEILPQLGRLIDHLTANQNNYVSGSSAGEFDQVLQYTRVMRQWIMANTAERSERSAYMADNLMYWIERERPDAKFVISLHNNHISFREIQGEGDGEIVCRLGCCLRKKYGTQYYAFGFDFSEGSYLSRIIQPGQPPGDLKEGVLSPAPLGSLPWYLSQTNRGNLILDLRTPAGNPVVEEWLSTSQGVYIANWAYQSPSEVYEERVPKKNYDGIVFIKKTTATRPTANAKQAVLKRERL